MADEITVVIAAFNAAPFLDFCLAGVENQTLSPTRVLVVDDASRDDTRKVLDKWSHRLPLDVIVSKENCGPGVSRAIAFSQVSQGKLALLDADDFWLPDHLKALEQLMTSENIIAVPKAKIWISGSGLKAYSPFEGNQASPEKQFLSLKKGNPVFTGAMFDRSLVDRVGGYPTARTGEDYLFWYRCLKHGAVLLQGELCTVLYRRHTTNISNTTADWYDRTAKTFTAELEKVGDDSSAVLSSIITQNKHRAALSAFDERREGRRSLLRWIFRGHFRLRVSAAYRLLLGRAPNRYQKTR